MTLYLDANATTPLDPRVRTRMVACWEQQYGNAGSPHEFGKRARRLVNEARAQIAAPVGARKHEVLFTSGATEANNLAILGIVPHGEATGRRHVVSTRIEHKAVLEPLQELARRGFEVTLIPPQPDGRVAAACVLSAVRDDTLLVTIMHVNNETGMSQPIAEIAAGLPVGGALLHVDAAQGFGKRNEDLSHRRIDLISISGHKIHGPQGIGALVARRREGRLPPLCPLMYGGGQEFGLRPGTLPVPLIVGLGVAAELACQEAGDRETYGRQLRDDLLQRLGPLGPQVNGDLQFALPHVVNLSFPGWDADQVIEALSGIAAVSDGAACTSVCATASHVLSAMGVAPPVLDGAVRFSWSYLTPQDEMQQAVDAIRERLAALPPL